MAKTVIRERRAADLGRCVKALRRVHELDGYPLNWPRDPVRWLSPAETYCAWVAERPSADDADGEGGADGAGTGLVLGHVLLQRTASAATLELARLFVAPAGRGLGLGAALLAAAGVRAGEAGYGLELEVVADERSHAIALYERAGWRRTGTVTAEWTRPDGGCVRVHRYVR
jgi:GNAT superfamily N-acetyltransferase